MHRSGSLRLRSGLRLNRCCRMRSGGGRSYIRRLLCNNGLLRCYVRLLRSRLAEYGFYLLLRATPTTDIFVGKSELGYLYKHKFYQQSFVATHTVIDIALVAEFHRLIKELRGAQLSLHAIAFADGCPNFEQLQGLFISAYQQITEVRSESRNEVISVETLLQNLVEDEQTLAHTVLQETVGQLEIVFVIEYVKILYYTLIRHMSVGEAHHLIEDRQGIAHTTVGLLRYHVQSFRFCLYILAGSHMLQVLYYIRHTDSTEVVNLASA